MKHRIGTCALVALVLPAVAACTAVDSARDEAGGVDAEKVVAAVDGREITMADLHSESNMWAEGAVSQVSEPATATRVPRNRERRGLIIGVRWRILHAT